MIRSTSLVKSFSFPIEISNGRWSINEMRKVFGSSKINHLSLMVDDQGLAKFGKRFHATKGNHQSLMVNDRELTDLVRCSIHPREVVDH
jgi:hypothetical protein